VYFIVAPLNCFSLAKVMDLIGSGFV